MKTKCLAFVLLTALALASFLSGAANPGRVSLPVLPELGTVLKSLPDVQSYAVVDSKTVAPSFEALVGQVAYTIAVDEKSKRVIFISTQSSTFVSPEGFSPRSKVGEVLAKHPTGVVEEKGFGSFVRIDGGWAALVAREGKIDPNARVLLFFRR